MAILSLLLCAAHAEPEESCILAVDPALIESDASTGNSELDKRLAGERRLLETLFGVKADLVLFTAGAPRRAFSVVREDGTATVYLSRARLLQLWAGEHRVVAVAAVLAHQYAHVLQHKLDCVGEDSCEEHADLLAGWFLGRRNIRALQGSERGDSVFASSVFASYDALLTMPFEQSTARAGTVQRGFELCRGSRIDLEAMCLEGLDLFPPEPSPPAVEEDDDSDEEPATEERIEVRCEPVIVCREPEREWVPGHYETVYEDVWVPPHCEEIFEPEIVGPRAAHADPLGRFAHRMGLIREARSYTVQVPGHCETVRRKVWVEGHYR